MYHLKCTPNYTSICKLTGDINVVILLGTSLPGYALLRVYMNSSKDFGAKKCSRLNIHFVHEHTMLTPAKLLSN